MPSNDPIEQFRDFADRLAHGEPIAPTNPVEATHHHLWTTLGFTLRATSTLPSSDRIAIWEELMSTNAPATPLPLTATTPRAVTRPVLPRRAPRMATRWHAVLSIAAMLVLLITLVGLVYQRVPDEESIASQVLYDSNDASTYIQAPAECVTNGGTFTSDDELLANPVSDWAAPVYTPVEPVTPEIGNAVLQTYLNYLRCTYNAQEALNWQPGTPVTLQDINPAEAQTYLSDRYRLTYLLYGHLPAEVQTAIVDFICTPRVDVLLDTFPLPVNTPVDYAVVERTVDNQPRTVWRVFTAADVYLLPDGRFGVMIGSISTADLTSRTSRMDDSMSFIVFTAQDGVYRIDEEYVVGAQDSSLQVTEQRDLRCSAS